MLSNIPSFHPSLFLSFIQIKCLLFVQPVFVCSFRHPSSVIYYLPVIMFRCLYNWPELLVFKCLLFSHASSVIYYLPVMMFRCSTDQSYWYLNVCSFSHPSSVIYYLPVIMFRCLYNWPELLVFKCLFIQSSIECNLLSSCDDVQVFVQLTRATGI